MTGWSKSIIFNKLKFPEKFNVEYAGKNKKIFIPVIVVVSIVIVLLALEGIFGLLSISFFGNSIIENSVAEIKTLQKKVEKEQAEYRDILSKETQMIQQRYQYWIPGRDGNINEKFQDRITSAAKNSKVELNTTGTVRFSKVGDGIMCGELEISCSGSMEGIVRFLYELTYSTPKMYWDRFSLRPGNYNNPDTIYLSGEVKFLHMENKDILNLFTKIQQ